MTGARRSSRRSQGLCFGGDGSPIGASVLCAALAPYPAHEGVRGDAQAATEPDDGAVILVFVCDLLGDLVSLGLAGREVLLDFFMETYPLPLLLGSKGWWFYHSWEPDGGSGLTATVTAAGALFGILGPLERGGTRRTTISYKIDVQLCHAAFENGRPADRKYEAVPEGRDLGN